MKEETSAEDEKGYGPSDEKQEKESFQDMKKTTSAFVVTLLIIVGFIVIVLGSIFFLGGEDEPGVETYTYNGFTVLNISGQWYTQIEMPGRGTVHNIEMRNGPMQVEDVPLQAGVIERIESSQTIYLTTHPDSGAKIVVAMIEIGRLTGDRYDLLNIPTHGALTERSNESLYVTCSNATQDTTVIDFRVGDITKVYQEDGCIIVQGSDDDDVIRASDRVGYSLMGLMG